MQNEIHTRIVFTSSLRVFTHRVQKRSDANASDLNEVSSSLLVAISKDCVTSQEVSVDIHITISRMQYIKFVILHQTSHVGISVQKSRL